MIAYGIGILPLINNLKQEIPDVPQPWYADDAGALGTFTITDTYFDLLAHQGPGRGYYPKPTKIILIIHPDNLESGRDFRARHGFKVCTGTRYLGGYIGDDESKSDWLRKRTLMWEKNINMISKTAGKFTQKSYAAVVRAIQSKCIFLQHVTWDTGDEFAGVGKIIRETFLPRLFFGNMKTLSPIIGTLSTKGKCIID